MDEQPEITSLFYGAVFSVALNIVLTALFAFGSLGYAFVVCLMTAILSIPLWGVQGFKVLVGFRRYSREEQIGSFLCFVYMLGLIIALFVFANIRNFP